MVDAREEGIGTEKGRTGVTGEDTRVNDGTLEEFLEGTSGAELEGKKVSIVVWLLN